MNTILLKRTLLSLAISLLVSGTTFSQVTIGSLAEPNKGALLDLKEDGVATKGLGLPRVNLVSNSSLEPCLSTTGSADADERQAHVGLVVYNVHEVDGTSNALMEKKNLLCKGLHVWDGDKWQPIIPYFDPDVTRSAPMEQLKIVRGPGGVEVTTYTTAYFHGYSRKTSSGTPAAGSVYVCDQTKLMEIDAGQWMTMNLRTEYLPGKDTKLEKWGGNDTHRRPQYEELDYPNENTSPQLYPLPLTAKEKELNGYLYNWTAATAVRDPDLALNSEYTSGHPIIQGICPAGWHLPGVKEWTELLSIFRAQHYLFGSEPVGTPWGANAVSPFSGGKSHSTEQGGPDFRMLGTRHRAPKTGDYYMDNAFYWSSTAGITDRPASSNGDIGKWAGRGYHAVINVRTTGITTAQRSRPINESVRCKKN